MKAVQGFDSDEPTTGIMEIDRDITRVDGLLQARRDEAFTRCAAGLVQRVKDKRLPADKEERKLRAYGEVLALLRAGVLRDDDLHAIKVDWGDAFSSPGAWQRG